MHPFVYRIAMHEKGGMELALAMSHSYSHKQMLDVIEMLDVYDAKNAQKIEQEKNRKT